MKLADPRVRTRVELAPQECFDREVLRRPFGPEDGRPGYLKSLIGRHFAGHGSSPTSAELDRALRARHPDRRQRGHLYDLFGSMRFLEVRDLAHLGGLPLYELARAVRNSGARPARAIRWLNRFASRAAPEERQ